jgi:Cellulase (glycosyl hydrolase family 5)
VTSFSRRAAALALAAAGACGFPIDPPAVTASTPVQDDRGDGGIADAGTPAGAPDSGADAGTSDAGVDAGTSDGGSVDGGPSNAGAWLHTAGNHIVRSDGKVWHGRGANLHDTRSCDACTFEAPSVAEVKRRIDELVDVWKANFIRLNLESYAPSAGRTQWRTVLDDPAYLADVGTIVDYIGTKPGVYVMLSVWNDPSLSSMGWPQTATNSELAKLVATFASAPHVLFGVSNEPQSNDDGALDAQVWTAMNSAVAAIRGVEDEVRVPHHIVAVQGTRDWGRRLDYYVTHPITAGGGDNVAYETHVYDPATDFAALFETAANKLPVIIGEFGPSQGMTAADCSTLQQAAEQMEIPHLAWTFHMRCSPNLLVDNSSGGCGRGMPLVPTSWGTVVKNRLAMPW